MARVAALEHLLQDIPEPALARKCRQLGNLKRRVDAMEATLSVVEERMARLNGGVDALFAGEDEPPESRGAGSGTTDRTHTA